MAAVQGFPSDEQEWSEECKGDFPKLQGQCAGMTGVGRTKGQLRTELRRLRGRLSEEEAADRSRRLCEQLRIHGRIEQAQELFVYAAIGREVDLRELAEWALSQGRTVAFPRCEGEAMEFYPVEGYSGLTRVGSFGILEPEGGKPLIPGKDSVMLVPGVVFSSEGNRIGMGKGYYDRYLQRYPGLYRIGVCYSFQLCSGWMAEETDVTMDEVLSC